MRTDYRLNAVANRKKPTNGPRSYRMRWLVLLSALWWSTGCGGNDPSASTDGAADTVLVGVAKRDITPSGRVYLGGYGFGRERLSTGVLAPIYVRALVISDGSRTIALAQNDTQGAFPTYKRGPFGLVDAALEVETATQGAIPREHVIITSGHSHAGPDTTGVWGGLPNDYMALLKEQTVSAILDAYAQRRPARLLTGAADAADLVRSQFDQPPNDQVTGEIRVLVAATADDPTHYEAVLVNFSAHPTVMGASNTLISADWPAPVAVQVEQQLRADGAIVMIGDCGRTQPNRDGTVGLTEPEKLAAYADAVTARVRAAAGNLVAVSSPKVDAVQFFVRELYANEFFPIDLLKGVIARQNTTPWVEGEVVGTVVSAARVGDLFFAAVPGEAYPAIFAELRARVPAARHFIFGLANDQLGYLIAPQEGYQQVADAAPDNDNAIFNVSPTIGDHVMCALLTAARQIGFTLPPDPQKCAPYAAEDHDLPY